jgi:hypothetical protein
MHGLNTMWFQDVERSGRMEVTAKGRTTSTPFEIVRDVGKVEHVKKRFSLKYGESDVGKYYPTSEVAIEIGI